MYPNPHEWWVDRFLGVFDAVRIVARAQPVGKALPGWARVDGAGVSLQRLPDFHGARQYLRSARALRAAAVRAIGPDDAVLVRLPTVFGFIPAGLRRRSRPYGVEVVGDPLDALAPGSVEHPLRPLLRRRLAAQQRRAARSAVAAVYTTKAFLQARYPCDGVVAAIHYNPLDDEAVLDRPSGGDGPQRRDGRPARVVTIASLEQPYKGVDVLIEATRRCAAAGTDLDVAVLGSGRHRPELEQQAARCGVSDRVRFLGHVPPGEEVLRHLDEADLFVLASRTEGSPRAILEAMGRGVPCIASDVGGVGELLPPEALVPPGDPAALAGAITDVVHDPGRRRAMAERNLEAARHYTRSALRPGWTAFLTALREATERPRRRP